MNEKLWPKVGSKVIFKGVHHFWFVNIIKDANELLEIGKEYTIKKLELASSWCGVILEEFPEHKFSLSFFDHEKELSTKEEMQFEGRFIPMTLQELKNNERIY
jgi:hypothetical protein